MFPVSIHLTLISFSDILLQYGVEMVNVFDTMAAHFVFARWLTVKEMTR